jgi:DDE domain
MYAKVQVVMRGMGGIGAWSKHSGEVAAGRETQERGSMVSYEIVRRWVNHFGPKIAADLRKRRPKPHTTWHLDEVYLKIDGRLVYLWRAVDAEGEVLDVLVQTRRNKRAALKGHCGCRVFGRQYILEVSSHRADRRNAHAAQCSLDRRQLPRGG